MDKRSKPDKIDGQACNSHRDPAVSQGNGTRSLEVDTEILFSQSLHGFFFCMLDEPIEWNDSVDKDKVLEYVLDHQKMTKVNRAMLDQYGAAESDLVGITVRELFKHDLDHARRIWRGLFDKGRWHIETHEQKMDGTPIIIDGDYICLYDNEGRITGHFGVQVDVTAQKLSEEALRIYSQRLSQAQVFARAGAWEYDIKKQALYWSPECEALFGLKEGSFGGTFEDFIALVHPEDREYVIEKNEPITRSRQGISIDYDHRIITATGETIWVREVAGVVLDGQGSPDRVSGLILDISGQKRIEQELADERRLLKTLLDSAPVGMWLVDEHQNPIVVNNKFRQDTGFGAEAVSMTPEEIARCKKTDDDTIAKGDVRAYEETVTFTDGSPHVLSTIKTPLYNSDGTLKGVLGIGIDITEQKRYEERLGEFAAVVSQTLEGIAMSDLDGNITFVNAAWKKMHGYDINEDLIGQHLSIFHTREQLETEVIPFNKILKEKNGNIGLMGHKRKDGTTFLTWMSTTVVKDIRGNPYKLAAAAQDITDLKRTEEELKESRQKYRSLVENIPGIVYRCKLDKDWTMLYMSDAVDPLSGYPASDFINNAVRTYESVIHPDDREYVWQKISSAAEKNEIWNIKYRIKNKNGEVRWVHEKGRAIPGKDSGEVWVDGFILDITEKKHAEEELRESEKRFMDVLYASSDAILLIGDNAFIDCNEATARMLGYVTREQFLKTHPSELSPPRQPDGRDSFEKAEEMMRMAYENGFHRFEWIHRRAGGEDFPVEVSLTPIVYQGKELLHCIWRDISILKKHEEDLKMIRTAVDTGADQVFLIDREKMLFVYANNTACEDLGFTFKEITEIGPHDIKPFHSKEGLEKIFDRCADHPEQYMKIETVHRGKNGKDIPVEVRIKMFFSRGRCYIGAVARDITERKIYEEHLKRKEKEFRQLFEGSPIAIIVHDKDTGEIVDANPTAWHTYGFSSLEEMQTNDIWSEPPYSAEDALKMIRKAAEEGPQTFEWINRKRTGEFFWEHVTLCAIEINEDKRVLATCVNIDERKKAEEALRESEKNNRLLIEYSVEAIAVHSMIFGPDGEPEDYIFLEVNPAFFDHTGLGSESLKGRRVSEVIPGIKETPFMDLYGKVVRTGQPVTFEEYSAPLAKWYEGAAYSLGGKEFAVVFHDITERKKIETERKIISEKRKKEIEEIKRTQTIVLSMMEDANIAREEAQKMQEKAEHAALAKSQFLANMSHEIRTPMNAIIGYGSLLDKTDMSEKQKRYIKMINSSGKMLLDLIDDILDISKIESGRISLEKIDFDLEYLCHDTFKMILPKLRDPAINTYVYVRKGVPAVIKGDPTRMRQILVNLLGNAAKFTEKGEIGLSVVPEGDVDEKRKMKLRITVSDTGIGIPEDKKELIFESFTQADQTTTRKYGGTGLGLTIARAIVASMGGEITVRSEQGKGSEFSFTFEAETSGDPFRKGLSPIQREGLKGKKAFIIDDNERNIEIMKEYCEDAGIRVIRSFTGDSISLPVIIDEVKKLSPDIGLFDIMMPGISGYDIAKTIRSGEDLRNIKLVAVTSDARAGTAEYAREQGFDGYLPKPVSRDELIDVISAVLGDRRDEGSVITRHIAREIKLKGLKVLVAEDSETNRMLMEEYLRTLETEYVFVENGQEAVFALKNDSFNICLMDVQMPVMSGLEATKKIREEISKDIPVIGLSAAVMEEDIKKGKEAGMDDYIAKPIDFEKLKEILMEWRGKGKRAVGPGDK